MNKLLMPYEAPELFLISVRVEKGFAVSSDIEPGEGGGELGYDLSLIHIYLAQLDRSVIDKANRKIINL